MARVSLYLPALKKTEPLAIAFVILVWSSQSGCAPQGATVVKETSSAGIAALARLAVQRTPADNSKRQIRAKQIAGLTRIMTPLLRDKRLRRCNGRGYRTTVYYWVLFP